MTSPADIDPLPEDDLQEFEDAPATEEKQPAKSKGLFVKAAIALIIVGGVAFYVLNRGQQSTAPVVEPPASVAEAPAEAPPISPSDEQPPAAPLPGETAPSSDMPAAIPPADGPAPPVTVAETPATEMPSPPSQEAPAHQVQGETMPSVTIPDVASENTMPADTTVAPALPAPEMAATTPAAPPEEKPADISAPAPADAAPTEDPAALHAKIDALEKQIVDMQAVIDGLQKEKEEAAQKAAEAPKKPMARKKAAAPKKPAPNWVLKAAKPGIAWISDGASGAYRVVKTGETVEGLGRITAIVRDSAGIWVVDGTKGRISQ